MCGIAGLQLKNPDLHARLGELVVPMLDVLASRGPDSAGVAVYRRDVPPGELKYSLYAPTSGYDWAGYVSALEAAAGVVPVEFRARSSTSIMTQSSQLQTPGKAGATCQVEVGQARHTGAAIVAALADRAADARGTRPVPLSGSLGRGTRTGLGHHRCCRRPAADGQRRFPRWVVA